MYLMKNSWTVTLVAFHFSEAMQCNFVLKSFADYRIQPTPNQTKTILTIREPTTLLRHQHHHD